MITIWRFSFALSLVLVLFGCGSDAAKFKSTDITGADFGKGFALTGHDGRPRTLADFHGKIVVLNFGFTNCPDVCPTTLADLARAVRKLGADADRVQVLFITLDPERDSQKVLAEYLPAFDPGFLGLYGDAEAIERTAKEFKVYFEKRPGKAHGHGAYTVEHSAQNYVFDAQGRLRLFVRHDRIGEDLAEDLRTLLRQG